MKFNKRFIFSGILLFAVCTCFSQQADNEKLFRNSVSISPLGLIFGTIGGNYEHLLGDKHGLMLQCEYTTGYLLENGTSIGAGVQYRHHYFKKPGQSGLNSPFWGPFINYQNGETKIEKKGDKYYLDVEYVKAGLGWGRKWIWKNSFNMTFRIGYGIPIYSKFIWKSPRPEEYELIESLTNVFSGIDGEFTLGFAF